MSGKFGFQKLATMSLLEWHIKHQNHSVKQFVLYDKDEQNSEIGIIVLACKDCQEMFVRDTIKVK